MDGVACDKCRRFNASQLVTLRWTDYDHNSISNILSTLCAECLKDEVVGFIRDRPTEGRKFLEQLKTIASIKRSSL